MGDEAAGRATWDAAVAAAEARPDRVLIFRNVLPSELPLRAAAGRGTDVKYELPGAVPPWVRQLYLVNVSVQRLRLRGASRLRVLSADNCPLLDELELPAEQLELEELELQDCPRLARLPPLPAGLQDLSVVNGRHFTTEGLTLPPALRSFALQAVGPQTARQGPPTPLPLPRLPATLETLVVTGCPGLQVPDDFVPPPAVQHVDVDNPALRRAFGSLAGRDAAIQAVERREEAREAAAAAAAAPRVAREKAEMLAANAAAGAGAPLDVPAGAADALDGRRIRDGDRLLDFATDGEGRRESDFGRFYAYGDAAAAEPDRLHALRSLTRNPSSRHPLTPASFERRVARVSAAPSRKRGRNGNGEADNGGRTRAEADDAAAAVAAARDTMRAHQAAMVARARRAASNGAPSSGGGRRRRSTRRRRR
jgi:hypothetical protein